MSSASDKDRQRRETGEARRPAAIGETFGGDEIFRDGAEDQDEGIDDQIGVAQDHPDIDEALARQIAWRAGFGDDCDGGEQQRQRDGRKARPRPLARVDDSFPLPIEEAEARRALALGHQSLRSSLMAVLERVCASTVFTITAQ